MHTPTKSQWQTVIDNFVRVLPLAKKEHHLDMDEITICDNEGHKCGTVHCVGGWYGVSVLTEFDEAYTSYTEGADAMAKHLGFKEDTALQHWARENPQIWGNQYGQRMFSHETAYDGAENLHEIIAFLEKVRDRSPE